MYCFTKKHNIITLRFYLRTFVAHNLCIRVVNIGKNYNSGKNKAPDFLYDISTT